MDKPIRKRDHNDCQQLITKSHGRSWFDSNIQPQEESNAYLCKGKGHCKRNVSVLRKLLLLACHRSQISGSVLGSLNLHVYIPQHITLSCILCVERPRSFTVLALFSCPQKTDSTFKVCCCPRNQIRNDISCEFSAGRWLIWNIKVYFLPEIQAIHHKSVQCNLSWSAF